MSTGGPPEDILNLLKPFLKSTIAAGFSEFLVIPEHVAIPLDPNMPDMQKPEGLVEVCYCWLALANC